MTEASPPSHRLPRSTGQRRNRAAPRRAAGRCSTLAPSSPRSSFSHNRFSDLVSGAPRAVAGPGRSRKHPYRHRRGQCRQSRGKGRYDQSAGRSTDDNRADRLPSLPDPGRGGRSRHPGLPLLSLVDLSDTWLGFSLREDLIAGLEVGDRFTVNIPALGNREVTGPSARRARPPRKCAPS